MRDLVENSPEAPVTVILLYGKPGRGKTSLATVAGSSPRVSLFQEMNASLARRGEELRTGLHKFMVDASSLSTLQTSGARGGLWKDGRSSRPQDSQLRCTSLRCTSLLDFAVPSSSSSRQRSCESPEPTTSLSAAAGCTPSLSPSSSAPSPPIALLFLDEADGLGSIGQATVASFLAQLQEEGVPRRQGWLARVVLACNNLGDMHESTLSRADLVAEMPRPSPHALVAAARMWGYDFFSDAEVLAMATAADGDFRTMRQMLEVHGVLSEETRSRLPDVDRGGDTGQRRARWFRARGMQDPEKKKKKPGEADPFATHRRQVGSIGVPAPPFASLGGLPAGHIPPPESRFMIADDDDDDDDDDEEAGTDTGSGAGSGSADASAAPSAALFPSAPISAAALYSPLRVPPEVARLLAGYVTSQRDALAILSSVWQQGFGADIVAEWVETVLPLIPSSNPRYVALLRFRADLRRPAPRTLLQMVGAYARHLAK